MTIQIFTKTVTESSLFALESEGRKYEGLYVDMNNAEERKFVKDKAVEIEKLLKKLDRSRIDITKDYKLQVEAEAKHIKDRLQAANAPFSLLINEWKEERKRLLDAEKARDLAIEQAKQFAFDYDEAIMMNKLWDFESKEREEKKLAAIERIREDAAKEALAKAEAERVEAERLERVKSKDIEHRRAINTLAVRALNEHGVDDARTVIELIAKGLIPNVRVLY